MNWAIRTPKWDTLAGRVLDAFFSAVQNTLPDYKQALTLFGSAPIQLCYDDDFASAGIDIMVMEGSEQLRRIASEVGVSRTGSVRASYGVQICPPQLFSPTPHYLQRAHIEVRHGLTIVVPHVRDVLIGKLHRSRHEQQQGVAPKDRRAFQRIRELTGGRPTLEELLQDLSSCEASFRPRHDGGINSFRLNAEDILLELYGHQLDLQRDIIATSSLASQPPVSPSDGMVSDLLSKLKA